MNFYYDPILGLNYTNPHSFITMDVAILPNNTSTDAFIDEWTILNNTFGIRLYDTNQIFETHLNIITEEFIK